MRIASFDTYDSVLHYAQYFEEKIHCIDRQ